MSPCRETIIREAAVEVADYFLDSSAVVKRYVQETGTAWIRALAAPAAGNFIYLARIAEVEVTAALARRRGQPGLSVVQARAALGLFRQDFAQDYRIAEVTVPLLQHAALLADLHALRGYDAVQLAAALGVRAQIPALVLVSGDGDLNTAAVAEGLPVAKSECASVKLGLRGSDSCRRALRQTAVRRRTLAWTIDPRQDGRP